jgi:hypothetical protein
MEHKEFLKKVAKVCGEALQLRTLESNILDNPKCDFAQRQEMRNTAAATESELRALRLEAERQLRHHNG